MRKARCHNSVGAEPPCAGPGVLTRPRRSAGAPNSRRSRPASPASARAGGRCWPRSGCIDDAAWQPSPGAAAGRTGDPARRLSRPARRPRAVVPGRRAPLPRAGGRLWPPRSSGRSCRSGARWWCCASGPGSPSGSSAAVDIAEAVRGALLAHLGDGAPEVLTGHAEGGAVSRRDHLAIVPMARIGDPHADGAVMGIGLVPPWGVDDPDLAHPADGGRALDGLRRPARRRRPHGLDASSWRRTSGG